MTNLNKRIVGTFYKQRWGGRNDDELVDCGDVQFDATAAVLLMPYDRILDLEDRRDGTDEIGRACINWAGPCSVEITDSICQFFGVDTLDEITEEELEIKRREVNPQAPESVYVNVTVRACLNVQPGAKVEDFLRDLETSVLSTTEGIAVVESMVTGSAVVEPPSDEHIRKEPLARLRACVESSRPRERG